MDRRLATALLTVVLWPALSSMLQDPALRTASYWGEWFGRLYLQPPRPPVPEVEVPQEFFVPEPAQVDAESEGRVPRRRRQRPKVRRGVRVSKQTILRLARARALPGSVPVGAAWPRPPGLKLTGVGGLGLGVKDGDVLTEVMGVPALNRGSVIAAVIAAREKKAPGISAKFWRGTVPYQLYVEMPYAPVRPARAASPSPRPSATATSPAAP